MSMHSGLHVVIGAGGQLGRAMVAALVARGLRVRAVARSRGLAVSAEVEVATGDIGDPLDAVRLCRGAVVVYGCFGAPHVEWRQSFRRMARGLLDGAAGASARLVFADNLYAYGPQTGPLIETMPATDFGDKPRLRAEIAAMLLDAHREGRAPVVIGRAADFYGPGVTNAMIGASLVRQVIEGERVYLPGDLDAPHTFTFIPDLADALALLGLADGVEGQVWHVPSAPAVPLREVVARIAALAGTRARVVRLPRAGLRVAAWFDPQVRELLELYFQWDRPYLVSHDKFAARFGARPTPLDVGLRATVAWARGQR